MQNGRVAEQVGDPAMLHLVSPISVRNYVRIADEITRWGRGHRLLDWGCGYGQMSYLLRLRGWHVTSYDVQRSFQDGRTPVTRDLTAVLGERVTALPFRAESFDSVLACGVLEHVADVQRSLHEIHRVLAPGGQLLIFNLPQRRSYKEFLIRTLGLGYSHDHRFTASSLRTLLASHGFRVVRTRRGGFLPHLATGVPGSVRRAYYRMASAAWPLDRVLARTPLLNRLAQSLEVVAIALPPSEALRAPSAS